MFVQGRRVRGPAAQGQPARLARRGARKSLAGRLRDLVADMRNGFRLSGWMKNTNLFVPDPRPPKTTLPAQMSAAEARNKATLAKVASHVSDDIALATWEETTQELEKGWIFEDKQPRLNSCLISRRFGVRQGAKVRVIDDGEASGINQTVGLPERFRLHGVEFISALLSKALMTPGRPMQSSKERPLT